MQKSPLNVQTLVRDEAEIIAVEEEREETNEEGHAVAMMLVVWLFV